jgi:hypothetical protein
MQSRPGERNENRKKASRRGSAFWTIAMAHGAAGEVDRLSRPDTALNGGSNA